MEIQAECGANLEKDWNTTLRYFQRKYPKDAEEFKILLNGGLPLGWDNSLPVITNLPISCQSIIHFLFTIYWSSTSQKIRFVLF